MFYNVFHTGTKSGYCIKTILPTDDTCRFYKNHCAVFEKQSKIYKYTIITRLIV